MMRTALVFAALALLPPAASASGDALRGKQKAQPCQACHGSDGNKTLDAQYPRIAGQYADYLARTLHDYRSGARKNPIMAGFAATLSEQDVEDLSAYFASLPGDLDDLKHMK